MMNSPRLLKLQWIAQRKLSQWTGILFDCQWRIVKNTIIWSFIKWYQVDLSECRYTALKDYKSANNFFIRKLKDNTRIKIKDTSALISPVDGYISQMGHITDETLVQAKKSFYTLSDLLAGDSKLVQLFREGQFINMYLAPQDYHRVHMPISGILKQMTYVPGSLFSVSPRNTERVSHLFARNERVISVFETLIGPMALIQVGALLVGNIGTVWEGNIISRSQQPKIQQWDYSNQNYHLDRMADMGYFKLGSTVILLFAPATVRWVENLYLTQKVRLGQMLGQMNDQNNVNHKHHTVLLPDARSHVRYQ